MAGSRQVQQCTGEALPKWPKRAAVGDAPEGRRPGSRRVPRWAPSEWGAAPRSDYRRVGQCAGAAQPLAPADTWRGGLPEEGAAPGGRQCRAVWIARGAEPEKRARRQPKNEAGGPTLGPAVGRATCSATHWALIRNAIARPPNAAHLAGGTNARRLRRSRWPGAGGALCPRRRASRGRFRAPWVWAGSPRNALPPCRRGKLGAALPVAVERLARRRWRGHAAIPHGVALRITGGPIAGRPAGGTDVRRLRRPRWPGAGGVHCPRRRASRGGFRAPRVWAGSPRDALPPCRRGKLGAALPVAVGRRVRRRWLGHAAMPHGVARWITGDPIAGRLAVGTDARRPRHPRWPGAGGVLCPRRRASRGRFRAPWVWAGSPRDALPPCRMRKLGASPRTAGTPVAPLVRKVESCRKPGL